MKSQLKKIASLFLCVCVALSVMTVLPFAADESATYGTDEFKAISETSAATNKTKELDSNVTVGLHGTAGSNGSGYFHKDGEIRIYANNYAQITSKKDVSSITIKVKTNKDTGDFAVYSSADGETWTEVKSGLALSTTKTDYTVDFATATKYIKISSSNKQIRIYTMTLKFAASGDNEGTGNEGAGNEGAGNEGATTTPTVVTAPVAGTAYKFGLVQGNLNKTLFINGSMSTYYFATTENVSEAIDVTLEAVEGGYNLAATIGGAKKYINIVVSVSGTKTYTNVKYEDAASTVYTIDTDKNLLVTNVGTTEYSFGTYNTFDTVSPTKTSYTTNFFCQLYTVNAAGGSDDDDQGGTTPTPTPTPTTPAEIVDAAYALTGSEKLEGVTLTAKVSKVTGAYDPDYGSITVNVVVEGKEDKPIECKYMAVESATAVEEGDTITVEGNIEVYNNKVQFYKPTLKNVVKATTGGDDDDDQGGATPAPTLPTPDATNTLTVKQAIALGESKDAGQYTEDKYYVTGVVLNVYNTTYGNMYIQDEEGNTLTVYGTYDEKGDKKYGEMDSRPDEGDTVTLYGVVGKYQSSNGTVTVQMKNAWIIEFTAGDLKVEDTDPADGTVLTIPEAIKLGETKLSNTYTENRYYVTGEITGFYGEQGETYGNIYIKDADGNQILVYGTYNEDGSVQYGDLEVKPAVGDTVTVYATVGNYNGTAQLKNGYFKAAPATDDDEDNKDDTNKDDDNKDDTNKDDTTTDDDKDNTTGGTTGDDNAAGNGGADDDNLDAPETGDNASILLAVLVALMAGAAVIVTKKVRA